MSQSPPAPMSRPCTCGDMTRKVCECILPPRETVLAEAARLVDGKRGSEYGHPLDNHTTTANLFLFYVLRKYGPGTLLGDVEFDADDVCWFNILQKCSRDANLPKRDNAVDVCGYAANLEIIRDERERRAG